MNDLEIIEMLKKGNVRAFLKNISTEDFLNYQDFIGNNMLHLMVEHAPNSFVKRVYKDYYNKSPELVKKMLGQRNKNDKIPANFDFPFGYNAHPDMYSPKDNEEKQRYENYKMLKIITKKAYYHIGNNHLYKSGQSFKDGMPVINIISAGGDNAFSLSLPVYPTIKLVKYNYDESIPLGETKNKKSTDYITFKEFIPHRDKNGKFVHKINHGEMIELRNIPITADSLSTQVKNIMFFPEDYSFAKKSLDIIGNEVKSAFNDDMLAPLHRSFMSRGGVVTIENTEPKHGFNGNTKQDNGYIGCLKHFQASNSSDGILTPCLCLNARYQNNFVDRFSTVSHELVHASDYNFKNNKVFKYAVALYASKESPTKAIMDKFLHIADDYLQTSFSEEALANVVSMSGKDEFLTEVSKLFSSYSKTIANGDSGTYHYINNWAEKNVKNKEFLDALTAKFDGHNHNAAGVMEYRNTVDKKYIDEQIIPEFVRNLKEINATISENEKSENFSASGIRKMLGNHSESSADEIFTKTTNDFIKLETVSEMNKTLRAQIDNVISSGKDKSELFKLGIMTTLMKKNLGFHHYQGRYDGEFSSPDCLRFVELNHFPEYTPRNNKDLIQHALRLYHVTKDMDKEENISNRSYEIALNTTTSPKEAQDAYNLAVVKTNKKNIPETVAVLCECLDKTINNTDEKKHIPLTLELIKTAEIAFKKQNPNTELPLSIDYNNFISATADENLFKRKYALNNPYFVKVVNEIIASEGKFFDSKNVTITDFNENHQKKEKTKTDKVSLKQKIDAFKKRHF